MNAPELVAAQAAADDHAALTLAVEALQAGEAVTRQHGGRVELIHPTAGAVTVAAGDFHTLAALVAGEKVPGVA